MTVARVDQAAVRLANGRVLILGGIVPFTGKCPMACIAPATASVEIYDPATGAFSANGLLAEPRSNESALLLSDGRVLVSGGRSDSGDLTKIEIYDPAQGTSVEIAPPADMPQLVDPAAVRLADGRVLLAGGATDDWPGMASARTEIFDPASGSFRLGPLMQEPRAGAKAILLNDGRVLVAGGQHDDGHGNTSSTEGAELFGPSDVASQFLSRPQGPTGATYTLLSDGRVLIAGGGVYDIDLGCTTPEVSEVFDPGTETFTPVDPMSTPRSGSVATKIQDGRVLFFGGRDSSCKGVDTVEAFDPNSGTFQVIATGFPEVRDFSATLLGNGQILIAGGDDDSGFKAASWFLVP